MMRNRQAAYALGLSAEEICADRLRSLGMKILATRLRTRQGEIDIVAQDGDTLVIVEVKARKSEADSLFSITPAKQKRLVKAAWALLAEPGKIAGLSAPLPPNIRFDVMTVAPGSAPFHLQDAWREE